MVGDSWHRVPLTLVAPHGADPLMSTGLTEALALWGRLCDAPSRCTGKSHLVECFEVSTDVTDKDGQRLCLWGAFSFGTHISRDIYPL